MQRDNPTYEVGAIIDGRYRIEAHLGRGGFASVYRAHHVKLDRPAALKVLDPQGGWDSGFLDRFLTEARIVANLDHPNVVRIFDFGVIDERRPYLAMELLEGHDLEHHLELYGPLDPGRAKRLFLGVLDALAAGHARGVVHKDLKPSNLFLVSPDTANERLVVLDYGIARVEGDEQPRQTADGTYTGTPAYMAPEYVKHRTVAPSNDVYQAGLIFIEALTGQPVVTGDSNFTYMVAHMEGKHRVPPGFGDTPLGAVLLRAIEVDTDRRYTDGAALRDAIETAAVSPSADYTAANASAEFAAPPREKKAIGWIPGCLGVGVMAFLVMCPLAGVAAIIYFSYLSPPDAPSLFPVSVEAPTSPTSKVDDLMKNMPTIGDFDAAGQDVERWLMARYMIDQVLYQVRLFEKFQKMLGWEKLADLPVPSGTSELLGLAFQQMDAALESTPASTPDRVARKMLPTLRELDQVLVDFHDEVAVRAGYQNDGGKRARALFANIKTMEKSLTPQLEAFREDVTTDTARYLDDELESAPPGSFERAAARSMGAQNRLVSALMWKESAIDRWLGELDTANQELTQVLRNNDQALEKRFKITAGLHRRVLESGKTLYAEARKLREKQKKGEDITSDRIFVYLSLHQNFSAYLQLGRFQ